MPREHFLLQITGIVEEDVDVERELTLKSRRVTPSQMNAKESKAMSAKHSPSKTLPIQLTSILHTAR